MLGLEQLKSRQDDSGEFIIGGTVVGYAMTHLLTWSPPTVSGLFVLFLMVGIGFVGFLDDSTKIKQE